MKGSKIVVALALGLVVLLSPPHNSDGAVSFAEALREAEVGVDGSEEDEYDDEDYGTVLFSV